MSESNYLTAHLSSVGYIHDRRERMGFTIQDIIDTLNLIEVKGKANLDRLLTAIMCLEAIAKQQNEQTAEETPVDEETKIFAEE